MNLTFKLNRKKRKLLMKLDYNNPNDELRVTRINIFELGNRN